MLAEKQQLLLKFSNFLVSLGISPSSLKFYRSDLNHFLSFINNLSDLNQQTVERYLQQNIKSASIKTTNRRLSTLRKFSQFTLSVGLSSDDFMSSFRNITSQKTETNYIQSRIDSFDHFLIDQKISKNTRRNYLSDVNRFLLWTKKTDGNVRDFLNGLYLNVNRASHDRTVAALRKYYEYKKEDFPITKLNIPKNALYSPIQQNILSRFSNHNRIQSLLHSIFYSRPKWYKIYHNYPLSSYIHFAILVIFSVLSSYLIYDKLFAHAYPASPITPNRYLSFQGRLTSNVGNPINIATSHVFNLYSVSTGGSPLWTSGACSITPDSDGIFSTLLGSSCGGAIPSSVFSENAGIWLGVSVGADAEATPRIQIATVAYALNSETLQGFPLGTGVSTVPYIDSTGKLAIAAASPTIQSTSGTFAVTGQAMTISTANTTNGSITINPDGTGTLDLTFEGSAAGGSVNGFINATNSNITSGTLYGGTVASNAAGYNFIDFQSGVSPTSKFSVSSTGAITSAGGLTIGGTSLSEITSPTDSGAYLIGVNDEFANSSSTNLQAVLNDLDTAITGAATGDITSVGSMLAGDAFADASADDDWLGLGAAAGRIEFDDQATDEINLLNANVGIGTSTPTVALDIVGSERVTGTLTVAATGALVNSGAYIQQTTDGGVFYAGSAAANNDWYIKSHDGVSWESVLHSVNGNLYLTEDGGSVGVGTTGPDAKLDSLATSGEQLRLTYIDGSVYTGFSVDAGGDLTIDATGNDVILADDLTVSGGNINTGNIPFTFGDATTDSLTVTTDGTGNAEVVLPNDSIGPNEVLSTGQTDEYCLTYEATGSTWEWQTCSASQAWNALTNPTSDLTLTMAGYNSVFNWDPGADAVETNFSLTTQGEDTTAGGDEDQVLLALSQTSNGSDVDQASDALMTLANNDTNDPVVNGIRFDAGAGGTDFTYGINFDAATIGTAEFILSNSATISNITDGAMVFTEPTIQLIGSTAIDIDSPTIDLGTQTVDVSLNNSVDALNFDSNTLSIDATNNRVGIGTNGPDAKIDSLATSGEQLRLTYTDGSVYAGFSVDASGNLSIDSTGNNVVLADDLTISGGNINTGNIPLVIGDATTDSITLTTDGTGDGEIVLPNDSIGPNELLSAGQTDEYCLTYEATGSTWEWQTCGSSGASPWSAILDPVTDLTLTMAGYNSVFNWDPGADAAETNFSLTTQGEDTTAGGDEDQVLLALSQTSNGVDVDQASDALFTLSNNDANDPVINGIRFDAGAGGTDFTYGINFDAATIGTAEFILSNSATISNITDGAMVFTEPTIQLIGSTAIDIDSPTIDFGTQTVDLTLNNAVDSLNIDSNTLSVDASNNRIGINTAAPSYALDVNGSIQTNGTLYGTSFGGTNFTFDSVAGGSYYAKLDATGLGIGVGNNNAVNKLDVAGSAAFGSTYARTAAPTDGLIVEGAVGIGTTGPDAKLDSLATSGEQLRLSYTDGSVYTGFSVDAAGDLTIDATGGDISLGTGDNLNLTSASDLIFGGTTALSETTAANDSGAYLVGANDEFDHSNSTTVQGVLNDLDTQIQALTTGTSGVWTDSGAVTYLTSTTDDLAIGGSSLAASMFGIDESAGDFYFGYDNSADPTLKFEATDADAGEFGFNTNDSFYFSNANVGIGTTSPSSQLHVYSNPGSDSLATVLTVENDRNGTSNDVFLNLDKANDAASQAGVQFQVAGTNQFSIYDLNDVLRFEENGGAGVALSNTGNFGIGDTSPASLLTVGSGELFQVDATGNVILAGGTISDSSDEVDINDDLAITGYLQVGSAGGPGYSRFGTGTTGHSGQVNSSGDVLLEDLEVDGILYLDGGNIANSAGTVALSLSANPTTTANTLSASNWLIDNTANLTGAALIVNQQQAGDLLTASASSVTKFTVANDGSVTTSGDLAVNGDDITSDGNLTISATGYVKIGDTGTPSTNGDDDDDLYVQGDIEVDGKLFVDGGELYLNPIASSASTTEGTVYYDSDVDKLYVYANGAFQRLATDMTKYTVNNASVANGSYVEIAHNQNTNDLTTSGWVYDTVSGLWKTLADYSHTIKQALSNEWNDADSSGIIHTGTAQTDIHMNQAVDVGSGADGAITIATDTNINATNSITGRVCVDGGDAVNYSVTALTSTTATLESAPSAGCLATGDEVLLINLRGTTTVYGNVGNYETLRVLSVSSTTVTFTKSKTKYYGDNSSDDTNIGLATSNQAVMLQRVPNYTSVTISTSGTDFTPAAWVQPTGAANNGGGEGGVMFFRANGAVSIGSGTTINANGQGYIGPYDNDANTSTSSDGAGGDGGEAFCGIGGAGGTKVDGTSGAGGGGGGRDITLKNGADGSCGGGGGGDVPGAGSATAGGAGGGGGSLGGGGGGGGYGTAGTGGKGVVAGSDGGTNSSGNGGNAASADLSVGGGGGGTYGSTTLTQLLFGSSGAEGAENTDSDVSGNPGKGGDGGGIVHIAADSITVSGTLSSNGDAGGTGITSAGGGGGGAGGSVKLMGRTLSLGTTLTTVTGGAAGAGSTTPTVDGGTGGNGRIAVYYAESVTGAPAAATSTLSGFYTYGLYHSPVIATPNAVDYESLRWESVPTAYGNIEFQTRSGNSTDPTDGTWEDWKPETNQKASGCASPNCLDLNTADTHTDWSSSNLVVSEGDVTRDINMFEDEDEATAGNITKLGGTSSTFVTTNLTSYWPLNESSSGSGAVTRNDVISTNHLTDTNTTPSTTGKLGLALNPASANSEYVGCTDADCGGTAKLDIVGAGGSPFSWGAWFKTSTTGVKQVIISKKAVADDTSTGYSLYIDSSNKLNCRVSNTTVKTSTATYTDGNWHYAVCTHVQNGATPGIKLYIDGSVDGAIAGVGILGIDSTADFRIGSEGGTAGGFFNGQIDEVGVWKKELTSTDVTNLYNSGAGTTYTPSGSYAEATISSANLANYDYLTFWVRSTQTGQSVKFGFGESAGNEQEETVTIDTTDTWQKVYWDLSDITSTARDGVTKLRLTNLSASVNTIYIDNVRAEALMSDQNHSTVNSTPNNYFQYRIIFSTTNTAYQPTVENIQFIYNDGYKTEQVDTNTVRLYNYSGDTQQLRLDAVVFGADLAEWYTVDDQTIGPGDLVSLTGKMDSSGVPILKKSSSYNDKGLVGAISTKAGKALGIETPDRRLLGLAGRIPVKINPNSPAVKAGDKLTSSEIPGLAALAMPGETIIGTAFEDWTPESGKSQILIHINNSIAPTPTTLASRLYRFVAETKELIDESTQRAVETVASFKQIFVGEVKTNIISPISDSDLIVDLQPDNATSSSRLVVKGIDDQKVASIDANGTATFAGQLNSDSLDVSSDATVSGTLYADKIESTKLDEIEKLLREVKDNKDLIAQANSWNQEPTSNEQDKEVVSSQNFQNIYITDTAAISKLFVQDTITANSLNSLESTLFIQPLALAPIDIMAGRITIDTDGNTKFLGNVEVAGDLTIKNLIISNENSEISPSTEVTQGQINTNAVAGKATLVAGSTEIKIVNSHVKNSTLVYVTPTTSTENKVLYVKTKDDGYFTVGFNESLTNDVEFNWWIIELQTQPQPTQTSGSDAVDNAI